MALSRNSHGDQRVYLGTIGTGAADPVELQGVQSFDGNWSLPVSPVKAAGYGSIGGAAQGEMVGEVAITRFVTDSGKYDPVINYNYPATALPMQLLHKPITGFLSYGVNEAYNKAFCFNQGRITNYTSTCAVGGIATSDISLSVYGDIGSGSQNGTLPSEHVTIARAGDIALTVEGKTTNAMQSYSLSIDLDWSPLYAVGSGMKPVGYRLNYPLTVKVDFSMIVDSYESRAFYDLLCAPQVEDLKINLNNCGSPLLSFDIKSAELLSNGFTSSIGDNLTADISYVAYLNTTGDLETLFPAV